MKRFHSHVSVDDLTKSIGFYSTLFRAKPTRIEADYAKWVLESPRMTFAISTGRQPVGVNQLGLQVDSADQLDGMHAQLAKADAHLIEESEEACCCAKSDKYWVTDPGIAWETFHTLGSIAVHGEDTPVFNHGSSTVPTLGEGLAIQGRCCVPIAKSKPKAEQPGCCA
jgi:hypothetical protein